jgi:transcriptional regulator with XRE-family HTH domain
MDELPDRQPPSLGGRVRTVRRSKGLSQRELARRAGLTEPFLSRVENAHAEPSVRTLGRLATAMNVTVGDLLGLGAELSRATPACPVSASGRCIAELIHEPGRHTQLAAGRYTPRQLKLLRLADYLVQNGSKETLAALETVMRGMLKLPAPTRDVPRLRELARHIE